MGRPLRVPNVQTTTHSFCMEIREPICIHMELTEDGICGSCGVDITSQEFLDSLPEVPDNLNLGDIVGIARLAQATAEEYVTRESEGRNLGVKYDLWILEPSYQAAKQLGYRGTYSRWTAICKDYVEFIKSGQL